MVTTTLIARGLELRVSYEAYRAALILDGIRWTTGRGLNGFREWLIHNMVEGLGAGEK